MSPYVQIEPTAIHVFPYVFLLLHGNHEVVGQARKWCHDQFGTDPRFIGKKWNEEKYGPFPGSPLPRVRWRVTSTRAKFLDETSALAFKMRWC